MIVNFAKDWKWKILVLYYFENDFFALVALSFPNGQGSHRAFILQNL